MYAWEASNDKVWAKSFYHHLGYSKRSFGLLPGMHKEKFETVLRKARANQDKAEKFTFYEKES